MENKEIEVLSDKETFLKRIQGIEERNIIGARIKQIEKMEKKEKRNKDLAAVTKELLECDYATFNDGTSLTFSDIAVSVAMANTLKSKKTGFKELGDIQRVVNGDNVITGGLTVIVNTHGQDLGDEV